MDRSRIKILSIEIDNLATPELLDKVKSWLHGFTSHQIVTVNAEFAVSAERDPKFREILRHSALNTADGIGILWAAVFLLLPLTGYRVLRPIQIAWQVVVSGFRLMFERNFQTSVIKERISGGDLIWQLSQLAEQTGKSVYILGGFGDTPELVGKRLLEKFPQLKIAGIHNGSPQEQGIVERVAAARSDILFVAFGPVTQEKWIAQNLEKLGCKVAVGLGGAFDYIASRKPAAPRFLRLRGLEWAWRLLTQPYRWRRITNAVPVFIWYVVLYKLKLTRPYRRNVVACILNTQNQILICRRKESHIFDPDIADYWQFPQGGLEEGESLEAGFRRELSEETGIKNPVILGALPNVHRYDWPLSFARDSYGGRYRGQQQSLVFARINTSQETIQLDHREFDDYRWVSKDDFLPAVHPIRRDLAKVVYENFEKYSKL